MALDTRLRLDSAGQKVWKPRGFGFRTPREVALIAVLIAAASAPDRPQQQPSGTRSGAPRGADGATLTSPASNATRSGQATPPQALNYVPPEYPPDAKNAGLEGTVTLQLNIDCNGRVTQAVVVESAGHGFDEAAVASARQIAFAPARRADGSAAAARILYRTSFTLAADAPDNAAAEAQASAESFVGAVLSSSGDVVLRRRDRVARPAGRRRARGQCRGESHHGRGWPLRLPRRRSRSLSGHDHRVRR